MSLKDRSFMKIVQGADAPVAPAAPAAVAAAAQGLRIFDPPEFLSDDQKKVWRELVDLFGDGVGDADRSVFTKLVTAEHLYRKALAEVERVGVLIKSPSGYPIQNPYLAVANKQSEKVVRIASELGLTPLARGRVKPSKTKRTRRDNPFGELRTLDD